MRLTASSPGESAVSIPSLLDEATGRVAGGNITIELNAVCNTEYRIGLSSRAGRLALEGPVPNNSAFQSEIGYRAILDWGATSLKVDSQSNIQASTSALNKPFYGTMRLRIEIDPVIDGPPNNAGFYTDTLTIEIGAAH